jgi:hypothetical protein
MNPPHRLAKLYAYNGEMLPLRIIAERAGLTASALYQRIHTAGLSMEEAASIPHGQALRPRKPNHTRAKRYTFRGQTLTLKEWAAFIGIKCATLQDRIRHHRWPIERALTERPMRPDQRAVYQRNRRLIRQMIADFKSDRQTDRHPHQTGGYQPTSHGGDLTGAGSIATDLHEMEKRP